MSRFLVWRVSSFSRNDDDPCSSDVYSKLGTIATIVAMNMDRFLIQTWRLLKFRASEEVSKVNKLLFETKLVWFEGPQHSKPHLLLTTACTKMSKQGRCGFPDCKTVRIKIQTEIFDLELGDPDGSRYCKTNIGLTVEIYAEIGAKWSEVNWLNCKLCDMGVELLCQGKNYS